MVKSNGRPAATRLPKAMIKMMIVTGHESISERNMAERLAVLKLAQRALSPVNVTATFEVASLLSGLATASAACTILLESAAEPAVTAPPPVVAPEKAAVAEIPLAAPQPQAPAGEVRVRMEFGGESWVEIKDGEGKMLMSQLNPTGSRRTVSGRSPLSLVIGNAANVKLTYNDKPVDLKPYIQIEVARLTLE